MYNLIAIPEGLTQSKRRYFSRAVNLSFDVHAAQADGITEIDLYDEIGYWGVTAGMMRQRLRGAGDVRLRIHSPGGDVYDGIAIYNDLVEHDGKIYVEIPGIAASAASIIAMAGDTITMSPSAYLMIHNVWSLVIGDRHDLIDAAHVMEQLDGSLADVYTARGTSSREECAQMMDAETFLTADDAIDIGLADNVSTALPEPEARFDLSAFKNAPKKWSIEAGEKVEPKTIRDFEQLLTSRDAKLTRSMARAILRGGFQGMQDAAAGRKVDITPGADDDAMIPFNQFSQEISEL